MKFLKQCGFGVEILGIYLQLIQIYYLFDFKLKCCWSLSWTINWNNAEKLLFSDLWVIIRARETASLSPLLPLPLIIFLFLFRFFLFVFGFGFYSLKLSHLWVHQFLSYLLHCFLLNLCSFDQLVCSFDLNLIDFIWVSFERELWLFWILFLNVSFVWVLDCASCLMIHSNCTESVWWKTHKLLMENCVMESCILWFIFSPKQVNFSSLDSKSKSVFVDNDLTIRNKQMCM